MLVPVKIRPHLIPFFYKEFSGLEAYYRGKLVKACKINMISSLGFMLRTTFEAAEVPVKAEKYYIMLSMFDNEKDSKLYNCVNGQKNWLKVPEKVNEKINDLLEDQFRIAFVYFVDGMLRANKHLDEGHAEIEVKKAIIEFMVEYELDECGFEVETMRRLYDRTRAGGYKLSRLQTKTANRAKGRS